MKSIGIRLHYLILYWSYERRRCPPTFWPLSGCCLWLGSPSLCLISQSIGRLNIADRCESVRFRQTSGPKTINKSHTVHFCPLTHLCHMFWNSFRFAFCPFYDLLKSFLGLGRVQLSGIKDLMFRSHEQRIHWNRRNTFALLPCVDTKLTHSLNTQV